MNKKGFAVSGIVYSILVLFLLLVFSTLGVLGSRKLILDKIKTEVMNELNKEPEQFKHIFTYTGNYQKFTAPYTGTYRIELWGAAGASTGPGAYTKGEIKLTENEVIYIYVGGQGIGSNSTAIGGYNGGGNSTKILNNSSKYVSGRTGGGATDIRCFYNSTTNNCVSNSDSLAWDSTLGLNSRIMVAAGGAGGDSGSGYSKAGGLIGQDGYATSYEYYSEIGKAGTQFAGGSNPSKSSCATSNSSAGGFGYGGIGGSSHASANTGGGSGGGSGYYGGSGASGLCNGTFAAGTGSSFISGHAGSVAIKSSTDRTPRLDSNGVACNSSSSVGYNSAGYNLNYTCSIHYSNKVFTDTAMIDGSGYSWDTKTGSLVKTLVQMPNPIGGYYESGIGHSGNGYAKITYIN